MFSQYGELRQGNGKSSLTSRDDRVKTEATETALTKQETKKHSSFLLTCCLKRDTPDVS